MLCAMWDLVSSSRDEPMPSAVEARSLNRRAAREVPPLQLFQRHSLELFHFAKLKLRARYTVTPHPPPPSPLAGPLILSVSLHLATLCTSYKCSYTVLVHL